MQDNPFGGRYNSACLSKIKNMCPGNQKLLNDWLERSLKGEKYYMVITGGVGVGKTYLCAALYPIILKRFKTVRVWKEAELFSRLRQAIEAGRDYTQELDYLTDDDFIFIDDVGSIRENKWREEILMRLVDERYCHKKHLVVSTNLKQADMITMYGKRIADRLFDVNDSTIIDYGNQPSLRQFSASQYVEDNDE